MIVIGALAGACHGRSAITPDGTSLDAASADAPTSAVDAENCPGDARGLDASVGAAGTIQVHSDFISYMLVVSDDAGVQKVAPAGADAQVSIHGTAAVSVVGGSFAHTITGVVDGDHLWFGSPPPSSATPLQIGVSAPALAGANTYDFVDGEGGNGVNAMIGVAPSVTIECRAPCSGTRDIVGFALPQTGDPSLPWWTAAPAQTLTDGQQIALPAWQPMAEFTATYTGLTSQVPYSIEVSRIELSSADTPSTPYVLGGVTTNGETTATAMIPTTAFGGSSMALWTVVENSRTFATNMDMRILPIASSASLDVVSDLLPWISNIQYDECSHTASWSETAGRPADGVWIELDGARGPEGELEAGWFVLARDTGSIVLPAAGLDVANQVTLIGVKAVDVGAASGYDDLRNLPTGTVPDRGSSPYY